MSFTASRWAASAISQHDMSMSAKLVLVALGNRHNQETGRCDPSIILISKDVRISERAVRNGIRELEKLKLIRTVERKVRTGLGKRNMTNRYNLGGGAVFAGGVGQDLPTKQEVKAPSRFQDLAMILEDVEGAASDGRVMGGQNV